MQKKILALMLLTVLVLTLFAGCKADSKTSGDAGSTAASTSEVATADDGRELAGNMYTTGLPLVKDKETFSLLIDSANNPGEMELFKRFAEETNVDVEWLAYDYDIAKEKKNLMYSSGDYPDAIGGWLLEEKDITRYGMTDGVFIPIEEALATYAPRITYAFDNFPGARQTVTTPDGHIYTIPLIAPQPKTRYVVHYNKKWLEAVGMEVPTTTDELYEVLKAFRDQDPNGNGKADEIGLSMRSDHIGYIASYFGFPDKENQHIQLQDGKPVFVPTTDGYKEYIQFLEKLYAEGLLDTEVFTHDINQFSAKGKEESSAYGVFVDWIGFNIVGEERYLAEYDVLPVLTSPNTPNPGWEQGDGSVFKTQFAITSAAKNPNTIIRYMDHLYGEDNSIQVRSGPYGRLINREADGSFINIDPPAGETTDSYRGKLSVASLSYCIMPEIAALLPKSAHDTFKDTIDEVYAKDIVKDHMPNVWTTTEESEAIATISTDIDKYIIDRRAAWVTGQSDVTEDWDNYLTQLNALGLEKYLEVKIAAITRSLENN